MNTSNAKIENIDDADDINAAYTFIFSGFLLHKIKEEFLHPLISGFSSSLLFFMLSKLFREPKITDIYNSLLEHIANIHEDMLPVGLLLPALSLLVNVMGARKLTDEWIVIPSIRLVTHLFSVAAGAMIATTIITILFVEDKTSLYEHMVIPAAIFFFCALASTMSILLLSIFSEDRIDNNRFLKRLSNFVGVIFLLFNLYYFMS